jgi:hypothetical protein
MSSINRRPLINRTRYVKNKHNINRQVHDPNNNIDSSVKINYDITKDVEDTVFLRNKLWAHLHCFNIDLFNEIYGGYISNIMKHFSVIVTYSYGNNIPDNNFIVLKVENRGYDIGPKFSMINYLNTNNIIYDFVLMLHSKSDSVIRKKWFTQMLSNLDKTVSNMSDTDGIYTIREFHSGKKYKTLWGNNAYHMNRMHNLYSLPKNNYVFSAGNIYILHSTIANYMYDNRFNVYSRLNTKDTFDYSWFINNYNNNVYNLSYSQAFAKFKLYKLPGNNLHSNKREQADGMIEHTFERIPFSVCELFNKTVHILN